jgi:hypothetical protein
MTVKDTHPEIEKKFISMLMSRSPSERLSMGCSMFDTAKHIALSSITEKRQLSSLEVRIALFRRFYGHDISEQQQADVIRYWHRLAGKEITQDRPVSATNHTDGHNKNIF